MDHRERERERLEARRKQRSSPRGPAPGKRSRTHGYDRAAQSLRRPPPGKIPMTLDVAPREAAEAIESTGGAPDERVARQIEATTGLSLAGVRVHTGVESQASARAIGAQAFAIGKDIHFAEGKYRPGTPGGDALLAHELVHTLQQQGSAPSPQAKSEISQPGDAAEREADRIAAAALARPSVRMAPIERAAPVSRTPETLSGNPAERTNAVTGTPTTTHRSVGVSDAVGAPEVESAETEIRNTHVKIVADERNPLSFSGILACPATAAIYREADTAEPGFTAVTGFDGTVARPKVEQEASNGLYIDGAPTASDVHQAGIGDCYFMALLSSIAARDPGKIMSMMSPDGNGGATVTLWRAQPHKQTLRERILGGAPARDWIPVAVTVSDQLAVHISNNRVMGAQLRCAAAPKAQDWWAKIASSKLEVHRKDLFEVARWAPLFEKAYARFAQTHDQYGGARPGGKSGGSGYDAIHGGSVTPAMSVIYGPLTDDPDHAPRHQDTSWAPGANLVVANAGVMDTLALLQGRGSQAGPGEADAPIVTAAVNSEPMINRLQSAIPAGLADADYANVDPAQQALMPPVIAALTTYLATPATPKAAKDTARQTIGNACVNALDPGYDESEAEKGDLANMRGWARAPITFPLGGDSLEPEGVRRTEGLGNYLRARAQPNTRVELHGHADSLGSDADNLALSQKRADAVESAIVAAGAVTPHVINKTAHGEDGANRDASWRRVDITVDPTGIAQNSLLDGSRSQPVRDMVSIMLNLRNLGTDSSGGQRNIYVDHAYSVVSVNIVKASGDVLQLAGVPVAERAALYPQVDANLSTVQLRNPHHGNEPNRMNNTSSGERPEDGVPSGADADGVFTMSLREFLMNFTSTQHAVFPKT